MLILTITDGITFKERMMKKIAFALVIVAVFLIAASPLSPAGSYILIQYTPTGYLGGQKIEASLYLNDSRICKWDLNNTQPWDRGEEILYFTPNADNCPDLDERNFVEWYVNHNSGAVFFEGEKVLTIPVWSQSNGEPFILLQQK